eukprot:1329614-Pyramimonas_sp.AAC.1
MFDGGPFAFGVSGVLYLVAEISWLDGCAEVAIANLSQRGHCATGVTHGALAHMSPFVDCDEEVAAFQRVLRDGWDEEFEARMHREPQIVNQ